MFHRSFVKISSPKFSAFNFSNILNYIFKKGSPTKRIIIEFYFICKDGTKETYQDLKFLISSRKIPKERLSCFEFRNQRIIKKELVLKLFPFTFFLIVPLSEILLPVYLLFFPNAIPRRYVKFFLENRRTAFLEKKWEKSVEIFNENKEDFKKWKDFDSELLIKTADVLKMEYVSLTFVISQSFNLFMKLPFHIINFLFRLSGIEKRFALNHWIFDYRFKFNFFPMEQLRSYLLYKQIESNLINLLEEDKRLLQLENSELEKIDAFDIKSYLDDRGFRIIKKDVSFLRAALIEWKGRFRNFFEDHEKNLEILRFYIHLIFKNSCFDLK